MERSLLKENLFWNSGEAHRQSFDEYKLVKVLPHIKEEFHFRVENRLMLQKIINPRRDKTIMESLAHTPCNSLPKKNKRNRKHISIEHRRKIDHASFSKLQTRPQTCQAQSQTLFFEPFFGQEVLFGENAHKQVSQSPAQERFQIANDTSKCRWLATDSSVNRQASIGKIIKNTNLQVSRWSKQTVYPSNCHGTIEKASRWACESQNRQCQKINNQSVLEQHKKKTPPNYKKLERRVIRHNFSNKENKLGCQNY